MGSRLVGRSLERRVVGSSRGMVFCLFRLVACCRRGGGFGRSLGRDGSQGSLRRGRMLPHRGVGLELSNGLTW